MGSGRPGFRDVGKYSDTITCSENHVSCCVWFTELSFPYRNGSWNYLQTEIEPSFPRESFLSTNTNSRETSLPSRLCRNSGNLLSSVEFSLLELFPGKLILVGFLLWTQSPSKP